MVLLGMFFGIQRANAQVFDEYGNVVWLGSRIQDVVGQKVYLYILGNQDVNPVTHVVTEDKGFLAASGSYGVQITNSTVGTRFGVSQNGGNYRFSSPILNPRNTSTNYMGTNASKDDKIFIDRDDNVNWILSEEPHNVNIGGTTYEGYQYTFYLNHANVQNNRYIGKNGLLTNQANAARILILTEKDYEDAMNNVTIGNVDLAAWIKDPTFEIFNSDGAAWEWCELGATPEQTGELIEAYTPTAGTYNNKYYTPDLYGVQDGEMYTINQLYDLYRANKNTISTIDRWHQRNQTWMVNGYYDYNFSENVESPNVDEPTWGIKEDGRCGGLNRDIHGYNLDFTNGRFNDLWNNCAQYFAAEIYNEAIECSQDVKLSEVDQMRGGLYKISMEALYDDDAQGNTNLASDGTPNAVLFYRTEDLNGNITYREFPIPVIRSNMIGNSATQITRHSGVSAGCELVRDVKDYEGLYYSVNAYMYLQAKSKVRIGIRVKEAHGWTVFNNVHIYALGQTPLLVDENWEKKDGQITYYEKGVKKTLPNDPYLWTTYPTDWSGYELKDYAKPNTVYYTRTMTTGAWNTICLPFRLNASQIKAAFGSDCKLSEFNGLNGTCIEFTKAKDNANRDWDADDSSFRMDIGKPYLIKPTTGPSITAEGYKIPWSRAGVETDWVEITPPAYTFPDVTFSQTYNRNDPEDKDDVPKEDFVTKNGITFQGNFYKKTITTDKVYCEDANGNVKHDGDDSYWVITHGNMYHLQGDRPWNIWATYAYLTAPKNATASVQSIVIEDGDTYINTAVEGLVIDYDGTVGNNEVYTLGGQKVSGDSSISNLKKGVYIMNGKKYVVR